MSEHFRRKLDPPCRKNEKSKKILHRLTRSYRQILRHDRRVHAATSSDQYGVLQKNHRLRSITHDLPHALPAQNRHSEHQHHLKNKKNHFRLTEHPQSL